MVACVSVLIVTGYIIGKPLAFRHQAAVDTFYMGYIPYGPLHHSFILIIGTVLPLHSSS